MIDSSKKQPQGFPEILTAEDFEPFKEKECLEGSNQKSLKEGQSVSGQGRMATFLFLSPCWLACLSTTVCLCVSLFAVALTPEFSMVNV
jgi:hypothetical protein